MRAVVTGGAGFIGSHVVDALLERGDEVTVIDNLSTGRRENLAEAQADGARLIEADLRDGEALRDVCGGARPDVVFHLGAQIDVRRSVADPAADARVNVIGTINMLVAAREAGARRFVNSSTGGAIYGEAREIPAPESHPTEPEAAYGQSKLAAEGYCRLFR
ncbi:MAG TPA: GDP-mannose 4,6-dehydratase, partial [Candidatus Limnocylindria bacterium]|nr:GDP-mannose 4,6-dehydratase [Candidatus Limnocylindria bacterium]